jgi:hypothetical protein
MEGFNGKIIYKWAIFHGYMLQQLINSSTQKNSPQSHRRLASFLPLLNGSLNVTHLIQDDPG